MATASDGLGLYADDANVDNALVSVTTHVNRYGNGIATVPRDEFLDAVARELDVIIIDRADLPEVWVENGRAYSGREANELYSSPLDGNPNWSGNYALAVLAVHEHIKARPPVDEAQVDALARALAVVDEQGEHAVNLYRDQARRLIQAGVRMDGAK